MTRVTPGSYGKLAKVGAIWAFFRQGVSQLLQIPSAIILARLLSVTDFGISAAAQFFIMLANRLTTLGLNAAIIRLAVVRPEHLSSVFVFNLIVGVLAFLVLQVASPFAGAFFGSPETGEGVRVAAFTFLIIPFGSVPMAILLREMRFRQTAVVEWSYQLSFVVSSILLAWWGFGFWSLIYGGLIATTTKVLTKIILARWRPSLRYSAEAMREILPFGAGVSAKRVLDFMAQNLDSLVVGRVLGITALGFYDKAFNLMDKVLERLTVGPGVSFRIFALIQEDPERFYRAYRKLVLSITLLGYPMFAGLALVAPQFVVVVFGEKWRPAVVPLQFLCGAGALKLLNTYISSATQARGMIWAEVWRQLFYTAALIGGIAVSSRWGITGAAVAVLLAAALMAVLMQSMLRRIAGLSWSQLLGPQVPGLVASTCLVPVVLGTTSLMRAGVPGIDDWQLLIAQTFAGGLFYAAFVLCARWGGVDEVVDETLTDLAPRLLSVLRRRTPRSPVRTVEAIALADARDP